MVSDVAVGLIKPAQAPSTPVDLGDLAAKFPGGECDVVMLAVPKGAGQGILDSLARGASAAGVSVRDERTR